MPDSRPLSPLECIFVRHSLLLASDSDAIKWAERALADSQAVSQDPDVIELAALSVANPREAERAGWLLGAALRRFSPTFELTSNRNEAYVRHCFRTLCIQVLEGSARPYVLCRVASEIESTFDFPAWLEDFVNICDSVEPETPSEELVDLLDYTRGYLKDFGTGDV